MAGEIIFDRRARRHGVPTNQQTISGETALDFALPTDLVAYLDELDRFIALEIKPIEEADDNIRFFDHRREWARTDFDKGGLPGTNGKPCCER